MHHSLDQKGPVFTTCGIEFVNNDSGSGMGLPGGQPRGELLSDLAVSFDLILTNVGDTSTFVRGEPTSIIDVTFSRGVEVCGWLVLDKLNLSDHAYVAFSNDPPHAAPQLDGLTSTNH